jgi:hypothetical protein
MVTWVTLQVTVVRRGHPSGIVWAIDGPVGHLAIGHRGGFLGELVGCPTVHYVHVSEALSSLDTEPSPSGIMVGYCQEQELEDLLRDPRLRSVPTLVIHGPTVRPLGQPGRPVVYEDRDTLGAVTDFATAYLGYVKRKLGRRK